MNNNAILTKKSLFQNCIILKSNLHTETADKSEIKASNPPCDLLKEKAIIIDIFQNKESKKSQRVKLTYTIQQGDDQRLNRDGVLRMYNINKPIEIPVSKLLGKWKKNHIGVTLAIINEEWQIEGGLVEHIMHKQYSFISIAWQWIMRFVVA